MKAIIFDLDGTLIDSAPDIHAWANMMLAENGYESLDLATITSFIGNGIPKLVERVMRHSKIEYSKELHVKLIADFKNIIAKDPISRTSIYPNVVKTLISLKEQGFVLGICTNKAYDLTIQVLAKLSLDKYFSAVIGGDSLPTNKPNPEMLFACIRKLEAKTAIFVGDSEIDASTANAANMPFILYTKGYLKLPKSELTLEASFDEYENLPAILNSLLN